MNKQISEVEKLYNLVGIEQIRECETYDECPYCFSHPCAVCAMKFSMTYPPFTAEKHIELIKWLAKNKQGFGLDYCAYTSGSVWECGAKFEWEVYKYTKESDVFEEALASLINNIWQDLNETEQNEIRRILE